MIFLSRVDVGFGVGLAAGGVDVPGGRVPGVFRVCVCGREVVPVCCGGDSVSGCGVGVGATVNTSLLLVFEAEFEFESKPVLPVSELDCEATSNVGSALGSTLGNGDGDASGSCAPA